MSSPKSGADAVQKWEYLFVKHGFDARPGGVGLRLLLINGREEQTPAKPVKWEVAERFGEEGWELVYVDTVSSYWEMIFKRPKN